jgi:hypothetical protein
VAVAIRTLKDTTPYQHEMNDALVKMHLNSVQFAKNAGVVKDYVEHDIKTMQPMLQRLKGMIDKTGEKEIALAGIFDRTTCLYQLCPDLEKSPGVRTFTFPYHDGARDLTPHRPVRSDRPRDARAVAEAAPARLCRGARREDQRVGHRARQQGHGQARRLTRHRDGARPLRRAGRLSGPPRAAAVRQPPL